MYFGERRWYYPEARLTIHEAGVKILPDFSDKLVEDRRVFEISGKSGKKKGSMGEYKNGS